MDRKNGGNAIIDMKSDSNKDYVEQLKLAYYANQLSVYFKTESIIAQAINLLAGSGEVYHNIAVPMDRVISTSMEIYQLFKYEYIQTEKLTPEKIEECLKDLFKRKTYLYNDGQITVSQIKNIKKQHGFFTNLMQPIIDAYCIVAYTLMELCEANLTAD